MLDWAAGLGCAALKDLGALLPVGEAFFEVVLTGQVFIGMLQGQPAVLLKLPQALHLGRV
jgi:hypothetical protein